MANRSLSPSSPWWTNEFLTAQKTAAECMSRTSQFPRAGRVNKAALDLADELIKGWQINGERGGYDADELVDVLYTLSRFTFHSQRISRLLFTILVAAENFTEAEKALDMYIQIVEKAREGDAADAAGLTEEAKRREAGKEGPNKQTGKHSEKKDDDDEDEEQAGDKIALLSDEAKAKAEEVHIDADSDALFINTLLHGAHVFIKYLNNARKANEIARKATAMYEKNGDLGKDDLLLARIKRVSGAARAAYSRSLLEPNQRPTLQNEALSLLKQSMTYDDQSSETYYQLAVLQAELHDVSAAVRSARKAVELEPAHVDYWHLLALLVSAQKDYRGALRVAEEGLAEAEDDDEVAQQPASAPYSNGLTNGSATTAALQKLTGAQTSTGGKRTTLLSVDYPPSTRERVEGILRLMITHNALEELVEGAQAAIEAQREIFEFFHRRLASHNHGQRHLAPVSQANGDSGVNGNAHHAATSKFSTLLGGPGQSHNRFHSLTGMGQSGAGHHLWNAHHRNHSFADQKQGAGTVSGGGASVPAIARDGQEDNVATTSAEVRSVRHLKEETALLCTLWLMAAATFRRNGNGLDCRAAIQEAERVDPGNGDVWLQLALWSEKQPGSSLAEDSPKGLAIQSLYKALACSSEHVGAAVHLARLFLANPLNPHIQETQKPNKPLLKDVASPLPQTTENFHASSLAGELLSRTQSRKISASPATSGNPAAVHDRDESDAGVQEERKRLATISMAEGLLVSLTQAQGWATPEAWLFLSKVMQQTDRPQRQRECLEYALQLERTKPIRAINVALESGC